MVQNVGTFTWQRYGVKSGGKATSETPVVLCALAGSKAFQHDVCFTYQIRYRET